METFFKKDYFGPPEFKGVWSADRKISYDSRPKESWQAMPVGTGKTGAAFWAPDGLMLQVNHNGSWMPDATLPGLLRVSVEPGGNPFSSTGTYRQELDLNEAAIKVRYENEEGEFFAELIAHPVLDVLVLHIQDNRRNPGCLKVTPVVWRQGCEPHTMEDIVYITEHNFFSAYEKINERNGVKATLEDPLCGLGHGTGVWLENGKLSDGGVPGFTGREESRSHRIIIAAEAGKMDTPELVKRLEHKIRRAAAMSWDDLKASHTEWWKSFWSRSAFDLEKDSALQPARAIWHLNRYFAGSSMAGDFPPKFNGSIFLFQHDLRAWCGPYWLQNTRLQYWPLFKTGDMQYLPAFFDLYFHALEYAREFVRSNYGHEGAIFSETMHFWGAARVQDVEKGKGLVNHYIKSHFTGSLELLKMMAEYYRYTKDRTFAKERLLPMADELLRFFFGRFPMVKGKLFLERASGLETWWEADNPADQIAGLKSVVPKVIEIARSIGHENSTIQRWEAYLPLIPELPRGIMRFEGGLWQDPLAGADLLPALAVHHRKKENNEDNELYSVWPFELFGCGLPEYEDALSTYRRRIHREPSNGWSQTSIWAARLGLAEEAAEMLLKHFAYSAGLPGGMMASPGENYPGRPDIPNCAYFDSVGAMAVAVNEMLMQDHTGRIVELPAWPEKENVYFKLHAASGEVVQRTYRQSGR